MKLTKLISILLALTLTLGLAACGGNEEPDMPEQIDETVLLSQTFYATDKLTKQLGRNVYDEATNILWLVHTASMAEFTVNGTKLSVTLAGDDTVFAADGKARVAIYLDGERIIDQMMDEPEKTIEVFSHAQAKEHTVKIIKLSESAQSIVGIKSIDAECYGSIKPTDYKELKIEFIGDSITCGYGVDDEVKEHGFSTATEDGTKTYAYKACMELDADYSMFCFSGHGIISAYTGDGNKNTSGIVPDIYHQVGKTWGTKNPDVNKLEWDFDSFKPDYIVVNLGTNDNSYVRGDKAKASEYAKEYAEFIKAIRKENKDAHIICVLGVMGDELFGSIQEAIELSGDKNVSALRLSGRAGTDPIAADWHPAEITHERAAGELVEYIKGLEK